MNEKNDFDEMRNIRFNITNKMTSLLLETILMEQVLELKNLNKVNFTLFYKHYEDVKNDFSKEFMKNNKEQIKKYNEMVKKLVRNKPKNLFLFFYIK